MTHFFGITFLDSTVEEARHRQDRPQLVNRGGEAEVLLPEHRPGHNHLAEGHRHQRQVSAVHHHRTVADGKGGNKTDIVRYTF